VGEAQLLRQGEGRSFGAVGTSIVIKTGTEETEGRWTLLEYTAPPQFAGPPPHWHKSMDETFFILEGTIRFESGGEIIDARAGDCVRVRPGVVHSFSNPFDEPGRLLGLSVPGGLDTYLEELAELIASEPSWPPADMAPVTALMAKHDTFPPPAPS
jgi:mannose-6-phosphate isomerase-like protein (cupin superfamily)